MNIEDKIREFIVKNLYYAEGAALSDDASLLAVGIRRTVIDDDG